MILHAVLMLFFSTTLNASEAGGESAQTLTVPTQTVQNDAARLKQKMQECLSLVDMEVIQRFTDKGLKLNKTVKTLCENNKRNAAQNNASGFALKIQKSKDLSIFKKCGRISQQNASTTKQILDKYFISDLRYKHICDYRKQK